MEKPTVFDEIVKKIGFLSKTNIFFLKSCSMYWFCCWCCYLIVSFIANDFDDGTQTLILHITFQ